MPPGYMQAATAPGRYLAEGFESLGNSVSEGLEKYRKNKEKREILTEKGEFVAQQKMQDLASWVDEDPQRADTPEYEQKLKDVQKFSEGIAEMPLGKLESAISNYSLEQEIEGRRFAQDIQARQLGIAEGNRADAVEDRETRREREAAFAKGLQLLGQVPTTKTEESPGYFGPVEMPQQPTTPAAVEPNPVQPNAETKKNTSDSASGTVVEGGLPSQDNIALAKKYYGGGFLKSLTGNAPGSLPPQELIKRGINSATELKNNILQDLEAVGASVKNGKLSVSNKRRIEVPTFSETGEGGVGRQIITTEQELGTDALQQNKERAESLFKDLETIQFDIRTLQRATQNKQPVAGPLEEKDSASTLPPVRIEMPEVEPEYKWFPPTTETRPLSPQERYSQIQKITAEYGPQMGAEMLGKFRNITTQYDPNAPSPIRETEGPSGQQYYYNVESRASGLVPNKNTISSTERATDKRIAFNKAQAAKKEQSIAKRDLGKAIDELEALKADPVQEEGKIKAAEKKVARLRAELDEATDLGTYDPLTGELK